MIRSLGFRSNNCSHKRYTGVGAQRSKADIECLQALKVQTRRCMLGWWRKKVDRYGSETRQSKHHRSGLRDTTVQPANLAAQESCREWVWGYPSTSNHVGKLKIGNQVVIGYVWPLKLRHPPDRKIVSPGWRYVGIFIVFSVETLLYQCIFNDYQWFSTGKAWFLTENTMKIPTYR